MSDTRRRRRWPYVLGGFVLLVALVAALWDWNWFKPVVEAQASKALGRPVTITKLRVHLARNPHIEADGLVIANPADWPGGGNFATADRLALDIDAMAYIRQRAIVIPRIEIDHPQVDAAQQPDGRANWTIPSSDTASSGPSTAPAPQIGDLVINDGHASVLVPKLKADFKLDIATREQAGQPSQIVATAKGTYAAQPVDATFTGGGLLSLRDAAQPYPIDLKVTNGATHVSLVGTVQNPLSFAGANLKLELAGPDMSKLTALTGVPIPETPPYNIAGQLDYVANKIRFTGFTGRLGHSDLNGSLEVDTGGARPVLTADLASRLVDLDDLAGFIGAKPGNSHEAGQTPEQRREVARAESSPRLLPDTPINVPKLNAADIHLKYKGAKIQGRSQPLDNISANLDIVDGAVSLHPLSFGVGRGQIVATIDLAQQNNVMHTKAEVDFQRLDIARLLAATNLVQGAGTLGGHAVLDAQGNSLAQILGHGNGELKLFVAGGGNLSALMVDLSGLEFGNALLSALGVPNRATLQCLATDFVLRQGELNTQTFLLDTSEAKIGMTGAVNLRNETIDLRVRSQTKHFSIGSLNAPIDIGNTIKSPSIRPELGEIGVRAGAAVALGIVATPLAALLPTIQFGTGEDNACAGLLRVSTAPVQVPSAARAPAARGQGARTPGPRAPPHGPVQARR